MAAVKKWHACLRDRIDVWKGKLKNLVILNVGVNNILINLLILVKVIWWKSWVICQVFRITDLFGAIYNWFVCSDFNLATASFSARSFNILLEMLATVIPCSFRKITESIPVVLFDKSISEADWILPVLMANWMAVLKGSVSAIAEIGLWWSTLIDQSRERSFGTSIGAERLMLTFDGVAWSWMLCWISGSICKFSADLVFVQLLCILLDLDWLERWPWSILPLKSQPQWLLARLWHNWLIWSFCLKYWIMLTAMAFKINFLLWAWCWFFDLNHLPTVLGYSVLFQG